MQKIEFMPIFSLKNNCIIVDYLLKQCVDKKTPVFRKLRARFYIVQTSRSFSKRFKEHKPRKSIKSANDNYLINFMHSHSSDNL